MPKILKWYILIAVILLIIIFYFFFMRKPSPPPIVDTNTLISNTVNNIKKITDLNAGDIDQIAEQANEIIDRGNEAVDSLIKQLSDADFKVRWMAIYSLAQMSHQDISQENIQKIITAFQTAIPDESNVSLEIQMAALLVSLGQKEQVPAVIDCLNFDEKNFALFAFPPLLLKDFCFETLNYYLDQDFQYDVLKWQNWWSNNQNNISWDQTVQKFIAK